MSRYHLFTGRFWRVADFSDKSHALVGMLAYVLGFFVFAGVTPNMEEWALHEPLHLLVFPPILACIYLVLCLYRKNAVDVDQQLVFDEVPTTGFEILKLSDEN